MASLPLAIGGHATLSQFDGGQRNPCEHRRQKPEPRNRLRLGPATQVKVMMDRGRAENTFAAQVTPKTAQAETIPVLDRNAPIAIAVSAGMGGNTFSVPASTPMIA